MSTFAPGVGYPKVNQPDCSSDAITPFSVRVLPPPSAMVTLPLELDAATSTSASEPKHLRNFHNDLVLQAAAYQNSCYVIATAKAGLEEGVGLIGGSLIAQHSGEVVAKAQTLGDELIVGPRSH